MLKEIDAAFKENKNQFYSSLNNIKDLNCYQNYFDFSSGLFEQLLFFNNFQL